MCRVEKFVKEESRLPQYLKNIKFAACWHIRGRSACLVNAQLTWDQNPHMSEQPEVKQLPRDKYDVGLTTGAEPFVITLKSEYQPCWDQYPLFLEDTDGLVSAKKEWWWVNALSPTKAACRQDTLSKFCLCSWLLLKIKNAKLQWVSPKAQIRRHLIPLSQTCDEEAGDEISWTRHPAVVSVVRILLTGKASQCKTTGRLKLLKQRCRLLWVNVHQTRQETWQQDVDVVSPCTWGQKSCAGTHGNDISRLLTVRCVRCLSGSLKYVHAEIKTAFANYSHALACSLWLIRGWKWHWCCRLSTCRSWRKKGRGRVRK